MEEQHRDLLRRIREGRVDASELAAAGRSHWGLPVNQAGWRADARVGAALAHAPSPLGTRPAPPIRLCGTGSYRGIVDFIRAEAARRGTHPKVTLGESIDPVLDMLEIEDTSDDTPTRTLCLLAPESFPQVTSGMAVDNWVDAVLTRAHEIATAASRRHKRAPGPLVITTTGTPPHALRLIQDRRLRSRAHRAWRAANDILATLAEEGVGVVEVDELVARSGPLREDRMSLLTQAHLSDEVLWSVCREAFASWDAAEGNARKAIIVDLDGTLWSGILAEDGAEALQMSPDTVAGAPHHDVQRVLRSLHEQGIVLAISSKNDETEVREALRSHPDMLLREDHVTVFKADWRPKVEHIREIADELGIALRHLAFLDDSAFEGRAVRAVLPDVAVLELGEDPASYPSLLLEADLFSNVVLTEDDYRRNAAYREESERSRNRAACEDLDAYLSSLGTELIIAPVTEQEIDRFIQLNNRSNRFNLNKVILSRHDLDESAVPRPVLLGLRARDVHGDLGFIGGARLVEHPGEFHLESFFMSCRVLGRGLPEAAVTAIVRAALCSVPRVAATYARTERNGNVSDFYSLLGAQSEGNNGPATRYWWDRPAAKAFPETPHVTVSMPDTLVPYDGGTDDH